MSRELYVALSAGIAYQRHLEMVTNNVANVSTVGFKADKPVFSVAQPDFAAQGREAPAKGSPADLLANSYASIPESYTDMSGGELDQTGDTLDMAILGEGFFTIRGPNDDIFYTRAGNFHVNSEGTLVNANGHPVLGEGGEITISSPNVRVDQNGAISDNGQVIDRLRIERFGESSRLEKVGSTMFRTTDGAPGEMMEAPEVVQGALEDSNVNVARGMVDMIMVQRNFEAFTKVVQAIDGLDKKVNQQIKL